MRFIPGRGGAAATLALALGAACSSGTTAGGPANHRDAAAAQADTHAAHAGDTAAQAAATHAAHAGDATAQAADTHAAHAGDTAAQAAPTHAAHAGDAAASHAHDAAMHAAHMADPAHAARHAAMHGQQQHGAHAIPATAGPGYTVADVQFMQHMIGHHAQAVTMTDMVPTHGAGPAMRQLAEKIDISQQDEIGFMKQWLRERGQVVPEPEAMHGMDMPGMLSDEEMARLDGARGAEFERLFLEFMIRHHEGALLMVEELFAAPGAGQEPDLFRFATDVDADQRDEIYVMQGMLNTLTNTGGN
ncbi:MAG TPA: DUF305 domain-containing protein [Longimicrobiales bacterium]|nr:DUF305 domain-containing protein [Longimicrobiales bacterium]